MNNELSVKKPLLQSFTLIGSLTTVLLVIIGIVFYLINNSNNFQNEIEKVKNNIKDIQSLEYQFQLFNWKEKDFIISGTHANISLQNQKINQSKEILRQLKENSSFTDEILKLELQEIEIALDSLFFTLPILTKKYQERGFKDYGLEGNLRKSVHELETQSVNKEIILMLRRHEKDFFLRKDLSYQEKFTKEIDKFKNYIQTNFDFTEQKIYLNLVNNYQNNFNAIVEIESEIGLTDFDGIKGKRYDFSNFTLAKIVQIDEYVDEKINKIVFNSKLFFAIFFVAFSLVYFLQIKKIINKIEKPFTYFQKNISALSIGHSILKVDKEKIDKMMLAAVEPIEEIDLRLSKLQNFAIAIGKKNFDEKLDLNIEQDELAKSLSNMRDELKKTDELDKQRAWLSESINHFIEETRNIQDNIEELLKVALINICRRNNFNQGAYFLYNDSKDVLEMKAAYAFDRQKYNYKEIPSSDGLIGQCFLEQKMIKLSEIPEGFFNITSGIGKALPKNVFIFPLIYEDKVIGVLELASFYILQDFEIEWLEKANEHISGIIFRSKAQEELKTLFEESKENQAKLKESEEQLLQNLEEIRATQEEMELREQQYLQKIKALEEKPENLN